MSTAISMPSTQVAHPRTGEQHTLTLVAEGTVVVARRPGLKSFVLQAMSHGAVCTCRVFSKRGECAHLEMMANAVERGLSKAS